MLYDRSNGFLPGRSDDTEPEPQQLLTDLAALVDAGLVFAELDREGRLRITPAEWQEESGS